MLEWFTVSEVSEKVGIPAETIRRYIAKHQMYLFVRKEHKFYQIAEVSIDTLNEIRRLYAEGKQSDEIDMILSRGNTVTVVEGDDPGSNLTVKVLDDKLTAIANMLMSIDERLKEHESFRSEVKDKLTAVHLQVEVINKEVAAASDGLSENMVSLREDMNTKMDQVLSRVETYGSKKRRWWKF